MHWRQLQSLSPCVGSAYFDSCCQECQRSLRELRLSLADHRAVAAARGAIAAWTHARMRMFAFWAAAAVLAVNGRGPDDLRMGPLGAVSRARAVRREGTGR